MSPAKSHYQTSWEERGSSFKAPSRWPLTQERVITSSAGTGLIGAKPENKAGVPWRRVQIMEVSALYGWLTLVGTTSQVSISRHRCPPLLAHLPALSSWTVSSSEEQLQASLSSSADRRRSMCTWKDISRACSIWTASPMHLWTHSSCICLSCR